MRRPAFSAKALFDAVDQRRRDHGLSWAELSKTIGVSTSMMQGMTEKAELETDSVLQMARWLGRSVESFCVGGHDRRIEQGDPSSSGRFLRIDTKALHAALDQTRTARGMSWTEIAKEIQIPVITAAMLSGLAGTTRIGLYRLLAITEWLGAPVASFTRLTAV